MEATIISLFLEAVKPKVKAPPRPLPVATPMPTVAPKARVVTTQKPVVKTGSLNWAALRQCESGGNYQRVSANGKYRGAYQFDMRTWAGYGPAGDPAAASPAEQDRRAQALYNARGRSPWPTCGRLL